MNSSSTRSDPQRPKRPSATARTTVKEVGTPPVRIRQLVHLADCCFNSCAEQSHKDSVREAFVEEQLCNKTIHPAMRVQLHLPALDLFWALLRIDRPVLRGCIDEWFCGTGN